MKEKLGELFDGIKDRLTSPFLLTFVAVWCIHHWKLLFLVSTFDPMDTQVQKISKVEQYLKCHGYCGMIWMPFLWAIGSMMLYLLAIILVKNINTFYDTILTFTYKKTNAWRKLRTKEEYDKLLAANKELQKANNSLINDRNIYLLEQSKKEESLSSRESEVVKWEAEAARKNTNIADLEKQIVIYKSIFMKNIKFQTEAKNPLLYLLAWVYNINNPEMQTKETGKVMSRDILDGDWRLKTYTAVEMSNYSEEKLRINGLQIYRLGANEFVGEIHGFEFETNSKIIRFSLNGRNATNIELFVLVFMNTNSLIGYKNNSIISLVKIDENGNEISLKG